MKRRGIKDTKGNRAMLRSLGYYNFTFSEKRKRVYIKVSNGDFTIIKELMPDD